MEKDLMSAKLGLKAVGAVAVALMLATGCGTDDPIQDFADAMTVAGGVKKQGEMPLASGVGASVSGTQSPAINAVPGSTFTISVSYSGGAVDAVYVDFGGDSYWEVPVRMSTSSGQISVPVLVADSLDFDEAQAFRTSYSVHGTTGSVSSTNGVQINACTKDGICTPGQTSGGSGDAICSEGADICTNGTRYRACVARDGKSCWLEYGSQRYNCAANCDCNAAVNQVADLCGSP
jgi:hypothetical protein